MSRPSSAQHKAEKYLREFILKENSTDGTVSIAAHAEAAGVSYLTMWKAVRRFKDQGKLHGRYRIRIRPEKTSLAATVAPAVRIGNQFQQDLLSGAVTRGMMLVSMKELCARYATSSVTLRRVLADAAQQGLLFPAGRHWSVVRRSSSRQFTIVFIEYVQDRGVLMLSYIEREILKSCEQACIQANVSLSLVAQDIEIGKPEDELRMVEIIHHTPVSLPVGDHVAGYICLPQTFTPAVKAALLATGKPVALYATGSEAPSHTDHSAVRVFNFGNTRAAGATMAAYLLRKGHHHVAYISPFHGDEWSRLRFDAMRTVFSKTGQDCSITKFTRDHSITPHHVAVQGAKRGRMDELTRWISSWRTGVPAGFQPGIDFLVDGSLGFVFFEGEVRDHVDSLLDEALQDPRITAWAMANDLCARLALDYCQKNRIRVPTRIAIVGFDDEALNREQGITSYSFNYGAVAQSMVQYILHPYGNYWHRRRNIEIGGGVVERVTG